MKKTLARDVLACASHDFVVGVGDEVSAHWLLPLTGAPCPLGLRHGFRAVPKTYAARSDGWCPPAPPAVPLPKSPRLPLPCVPHLNPALLNVRLLAGQQPVVLLPRVPHRLETPKSPRSEIPSRRCPHERAHLHSGQI